VRRWEWRAARSEPDYDNEQDYDDEHDYDKDYYDNSNDDD
jgi:hypothetical protein